MFLLKMWNLTAGFSSVLALLDGDFDGDAENTDLTFFGLDSMTATIHAKRRD